MKKNVFNLGFVLLIFLGNTVYAERFCIILDPGHGGKDSGAVVEYLVKENEIPDLSSSKYTLLCEEINKIVVKEKDLNYKIALHMEKEFKKYANDKGEEIEVYITHKEDDNPNLESRVQLGIEKEANLVVSIHNNATEIKTRCKKNSKETHSGSMILVTNAHSKDLQGNDLHIEEERLGLKILENLKSIGITPSPFLPDGLFRRLSENGTKYDTGEIADYYRIVKEGIIKKILSIIVECAYLNNPYDYENFLNSDEKLQKIAVSIVKAIADFYNLKLVVSYDNPLTKN
ncbi:MAG: N-acetylmuramoyl-L-alanine amidase [Candidatus Paraimprobicoccus trichonymphae]|uniref:N-acetylmuramoyl-L-alanine amidase n=1 Tax=Candidatus Paraimprobicoccus trichonymphae TaxID=3033793 RepID=A0AA48HWP9_9FIRM|nr:MAG: N-acetylmuramoyl-L-alanine amidase [Candidatus Paraimprobicoccus trichonymphae]